MRQGIDAFCECKRKNENVWYARCKCDFCVRFFYRRTYDKTFVNIVVELYNGWPEPLQGNSLSKQQSQGIDLKLKQIQGNSLSKQQSQEIDLKLKQIQDNSLSKQKSQGIDITVHK